MRGFGGTVERFGNRKSLVGASETTYGFGGGPVKMPDATGAPRTLINPSGSFSSWNCRLAINPDCELVLRSLNRLNPPLMASLPSNPGVGVGCSPTFVPSMNIDIVLVVSTANATRCQTF